MRRLILAAGAAAALAGVAYGAPSKWYPIAVEEWEPPFDMASPRKATEYTPLEKASQKWNVCVSVPHLKDAYWVAVDYGVTEEAKRQGIKLTVVDVSGYDNLSKQISQIEDCVAAGAQAVILGAISEDGLNNMIKELKGQGIPVIDFMNGVTSKDIQAKSLVSFGEMGSAAGLYLTKAHPKGSGVARLGGFQAPPEPDGWSRAISALSMPSNPVTFRSSRPSTETPAKRFS